MATIDIGGAGSPFFPVVRVSSLDYWSALNQWTKGGFGVHDYVVVGNNKDFELINSVFKTITLTFAPSQAPTYSCRLWWFDATAPNGSLYTQYGRFFLATDTINTCKVKYIDAVSNGDVYTFTLPDNFVFSDYLGDDASCRQFPYGGEDFVATDLTSSWGLDFDGGSYETITIIDAQAEVAGGPQPRLFRHTGRTVEYTHTPPPPPPYTPPPPATASPSPSRPPNRPPVTNVTPPPSRPPGTGVSGQTGRTLVPCGTYAWIDGVYRQQSAIWETGPNNSLVRQISPCQ